MKTQQKFRCAQHTAYLSSAIAISTVLALSGCQQPSTQQNNDDLNDWVYNPITTHYYKLTDTGSWTEAAAQSVTNGGYLVTVNDATENAWLLATFAQATEAADGLWIGLSCDSATTPQWNWVNNDTYEYTNWDDSEPMTGNDRAALLGVTDGLWSTLSPALTNRPGIIERDTTDTSSNNNLNGDSNAAPLTMRFTHTGTLESTSSTQDLSVTFDGTGTFTAEPNETTTVTINYEQAAEFTNKPTSDGELISYEPSSFTLSGTLAWEITYIADENGTCFRVSSTIGDTDTQTVDVTIISPDGTLSLDPETFTTFDGDLGGTFAPNETSGEDRCTAPYVWTSQFDSSGQDPAGSWIRDLTITLEVISGS